MPRTPHRPRQHTAGFGVVDKVLFFRVPLKLASQPDCNVVQLADRVRADGNIYWARRPLAHPDGVQEIPVVVTAGHEVDLIGTDDRF